jgi:hypothetical protein
MFSGTTLNFHFDTKNMVSPTSEVTTFLPPFLPSLSHPLTHSHLHLFAPLFSLADSLILVPTRSLAHSPFFVSRSRTPAPFPALTHALSLCACKVYWTVDQGPKTLSLVLPTVSVAIPVNNTHGDVPYHTVELFVKSTTERANRWAATGPSTRVILTGIETDGKLAPWIPSDVNVLVYGDSITEGVLALGGSQSFDTDHNDGSVVYSYTLGRLLGSEIGVIGFGYNALTHAGSGGVAPLGIAWNQLWDGTPRSFTDPKPDLIVLNEGGIAAVLFSLVGLPCPTSSHDMHQHNSRLFIAIVPRAVMPHDIVCSEPL